VWSVAVLERRVLLFGWLCLEGDYRDNRPLRNTYEDYAADSHRSKLDALGARQGVAKRAELVSFVRDRKARVCARLVCRSNSGELDWRVSYRIMTMIRLPRYHAGYTNGVFDSTSYSTTSNSQLFYVPRTTNWE
jgi:hypothetical protein